MAVFEMAWFPGTPPVVVLDEAIEVGKKYGSEQSGAFVNGILDAIRKRIERGEIPVAGGGGERA
jgi:N utilization substance protein B